MNIEANSTVAVLGLGTMGHGIAQCFAVAGYSVRGYDQEGSSRETLIQRIQANLLQMVEAGIGRRESIDEVLGRITVSASEAEAVGPADFVTEAVQEDLEVKRQLFARLESEVGPQTILASNSSSFPITQTAAGMQRPDRAIVTHWFNPPHIVPVVEVVPGEKTSEQTTRTTEEILTRIGKNAIRLNKEIPGFLVNRVQVAMFREVWDLLEQGVASAEQIDEAIRGSMGLRLAAIGPLEISDFAGWDVNALTYKFLIEHMRSNTTLPKTIKQLVDDGHWGVKTGQGIYNYTPESAQQRLEHRDQCYLALVKLLHQDSLHHEET